MNLSRASLVIISLLFNVSLHAQTITLSERNTPLSIVIDKLKAQTGYEFIWDKRVMENARPIFVQVVSVSLEEALQAILKNQPISFQIISKVVLLNPAKNSAKTKLPPKKVTKPAKEDILFGQIVTVDSIGIPMASVIIKGKDAVFTNVDGTFAIRAAKGDTLSVIMAGYENQAIAIEDLQLLVVKLKYLIQEKTPEEVSVGYYKLNPIAINGATRPLGTQNFFKESWSSNEKGDFNLSSLRDAAQFGAHGAALNNIAQGKQGLVDVLIVNNAVQQPYYNNAAVINRGGSNLLPHIASPGRITSTSNAPLIVLDGLVQTVTNLNDIIVLEDIGSIRFLKDVATTAVYGSRAANGVWVVESKKGASSAFNMEIDLNFSYTKAPKKALLSGQELYQRQADYLTADYAVRNAALNGSFPTAASYLTAKLPSQEQMESLYDWEKLMLPAAFTKQLSFNMSESRSKNSYYLSGSILSQDGPLASEKFQKNALRFHYDTEISKKLALNTYIKGVFQEAKLHASQLRNNINRLAPWANPYDKAGAIKPVLHFRMNGIDKEIVNPIAQNEMNKDVANSQWLSGVVELDWKIKTWLSFKSNNGVNFYKDEEKLTHAITPFNELHTDGAEGQRIYKNLSVVSTQQLLAKKRIRQHQISGIAGVTLSIDNKRNQINNVYFPDQRMPLIGLNKEIGSFSNLFYHSPYAQIKTGERLAQTLNTQLGSMFVAGNYVWKGKYHFNASWSFDREVSADRSDRKGNFYAIGSSWDIAAESFFKQNKKLQKTVQQLRIYVNYGSVGVPADDVFLSSAIAANYAGYNNHKFVPVESMGNRPVNWERIQEFNAGSEIGIGKYVQLNVDYYHRKSNNLLERRITTPGSSMFIYSWEHGAGMKNTGLEMQLLATVFKNKKLEWSVGLNGSLSKNALTKVESGGFPIVSDFFTPYRLQSGDPISTIKAVKYAGVDPQTGTPQFEKLVFNPDGSFKERVLVNTVAATGAITDPRQLQTIGTLQPKLFGGFTNHVQVGKVAVGALVAFEFGHVAYNIAAAHMQGAEPMEQNQLKYSGQQIVWDQAGQTNATEPWHYYQATTNYKGSDKYIQKGNHAMLKSIQCRYPIPEKWLEKLKILTDGAFYLSAHNLVRIKSKTSMSDQFRQMSLIDLKADDAASFAPWDLQKSFVIGIKMKL